MRLGIYMGSFDPPHIGHISLVNYLLDNNYLDKILIIPTLDYWNKHIVADIDKRIEMLKFFENERIKIDTNHNKYIYTYDLISVLKKDYPNTSLYLIIGADNLVNFDKWKNYQELLKEKIIVIKRDGIDSHYYINKLDGKNFYVIDDYKEIKISSSKLRENIEEEYLDKRVLAYIKRNHLYK